MRDGEEGGRGRGSGGTVLQPSGDDNRGPLRLDISGAQAIVMVEAA